jgi:MFS family permease
MTTTGAASAPNISTRELLRDPYIRPVIGLVFVVLTGFGLVLPVLPLFVRSLGVGYGGIGILLSIFGFARLFGDLIGGSIVDRKGERWTAITGMAILGTCSVATGLAPNYAFALLSWGLAGIGSAILFASLFSYILKVAPKEGTARTLSLFFGAFNIGAIAGSGAGGVIAEVFGFASPLFVYAGVLVIAAFVYLRFVPVLPPRNAPEAPGLGTVAGDIGSPPSEPVLAVRDLLKVRGFVTALLLNFMYLWLVATVFNTLLPLFGRDELDMSPGAIGVVLSIAIAAEFIVLFPAGSLADRHGRKPVMIPSLIALLIFTVAMGWATSPVMLAIVMSFLAFSSGFAGVPAAAILSDVVPTEQSGRGVGAFRFCGDLGFFLGPLVAGASSSGLGFKAAFAICAAPALVALAVTIATPETLGYQERTKLKVGTQEG